MAARLAAAARMERVLKVIGLGPSVGHASTLQGRSTVSNWEDGAGPGSVHTAHTASQNETDARWLPEMAPQGRLMGGQVGRKLTLATAASTQTTGADIDSHARLRRRRE